MHKSGNRGFLSDDDHTEFRWGVPRGVYPQKNLSRTSGTKVCFSGINPWGYMTDRYLWRFYEDFRGLWCINQEIGHFGYFWSIHGGVIFWKKYKKRSIFGFYLFYGTRIAIFCPNNRRLKIYNYWGDFWVMVTILSFDGGSPGGYIHKKIWPERSGQKWVFLE